MLELISGGAPVALSSEFEVGFAGEHGVQARVGLADAALLAFERAAPVRGFPSYRRQRHFPGLWWSATTGGHVGYESWLERDHLMLLDFDPEVVGIASQPFWLFWQDGDRSRSHAPDYFARRSDGAGIVVDCRPTDRIKPRDATAFETTRRACAQVGWEYRLVGAVDPVAVANVRWLSGYRHPRHEQAELAAALREVFAEPTGLIAGAGEVGDPIAVLPVLFHLMWQHRLVADLKVPLDAGTTVMAA